MTRFVYNEETIAPAVDIDGVGSFYQVYPSKRGVAPEEFQKMLFVSSMPLSESDLYYFSGAIGYAWQATVKGDRLATIHRHGADGFYVEVELLSSKRSDPVSAFAEFIELIETIVNEGSPVRKDKTRQIYPIVSIRPIRVSVYVDQVFQTVSDDYVPARSKKVEQSPSVDDWDYVAPTAPTAQVETETGSIPGFDELRAELAGVAALPNLTSREKYVMELAEKALATAEARDARTGKALKVIEKALDALA